MMKRIILSLFLVLLALSLQAQAPNGFKYQTVVRSADGTSVIADQFVAFRITILAGSSSGTEVYVETFSVETNQYGIATFNIGEGNCGSWVFEDIDWGSNSYWVKVEVDPVNDGASFEVAGISQLLSVPYALYSESSKLADSLSTELASVNERLAEAQIGLVLWNQLGSVSEVLNSEIGENGTLIGTAHAFEPAKFGNGYVRKDINSSIKFPKSVLQSLRSRGTIELWVNPKVANPLPGNYGAFMIVGFRINDLDAHAFIRWGDGTTGRGINGGVNFAGTPISTPNEASQFVATIDVPFHLALCWDVDGIDNSIQTVRLYRDGVLVGSNTTSWNDQATTDYDDFILGTGPDANGYDKFITDNIKVWNYAKTDFEDRNVEDEAVSNDRVLKSTIDDMTSSGTMSYGTIDVNNVGFGAALFMASDGNYEEADADALITMPCVALALETGTGNKKILLQGYIRNDEWNLTPGGLIYISPTTGTITQTIPSTSGQQVQIVGYATSSNTIFFNPNLMLLELK